MKLVFITLLFIIGFLATSFSNEKVDSLLVVLNKTEVDTIRVDVLLNLYRLHRRNAPDSAMNYANQALSLSQQSNYLSGAINSQYFLGMLHYRKGRFEQSKACFSAALDIAENSNYNHLVNKALNALGMICISRGQLDEAEAFYLKSLHLSETYNDSSSIAVAYNNLGSLYGNIGDYPKAAGYFKKSLAVYEIRGDEDDMVTGLLDLGMVERYSGNYKAALVYYDRALVIATRIEDNDLISYLYGCMGGVYKDQGDYIDAIQYYEEGLVIGRGLGNQSFIAEMHDRIGSIHEIQKDYTLALVYYNDALEIRKRIGEELTVSDSYLNIASVYLHQDELDKAAETIKETLVLCEKLKLKGVKAQAYQIYGKVELKKKRYSQAIKYLNLALIDHKEIGEENEIACDLVALGNSFFEMQIYDKALAYGEQAYEIALGIGAKDVNKQATELLSKSFAEVGDFSKAYHFHKLFKQTYDSLFTMESKQSISAMETRFVLERNKQHIALQEAQLEKQSLEIKQKQLLQNVLIFGILSGLSIVVLMLINYRKVRKANTEITKQKEEITLQRNEIMNTKNILSAHNQKITHSINYAKRIQQAVLPSNDQLKELLVDHFVFFKPCDIVSGDFYWVSKVREQTIIAVVDCTGHGVPGAFMSMLVLSFLKEINHNCNEYNSAANILDVLREKVKNNLQQNINSGQWDGMDMGLCIIDKDNMKMQYAGAHNALIKIANDEIDIVKGNKQPVSLYLKETPFDNHIVPIKKGDTFYMYTDGYSDQFGGKYKKKFQSSNLNKLLFALHNKPMKQQETLLAEKYNAWKGDFEQTDDVLVLGFKI